MSNCNCQSCATRRAKYQYPPLEDSEARLKEQLKSAVAALQEIERIASRMDPDNTSRTWQNVAALAFKGQP